jgi:hypothetical protein
MDLIQLAKQYQGKTLTALIEAHTRTMSREILIQAIRGSLIEFDEALRPQMDGIAEDYFHTWLEPNQTDSDLGNLFSRAISEFRTQTLQSGHELDDKRLFDLFHVSVLKLALLAQTDPAIKALFRST